jgi:YjbE family integral membrane protein
LQSIAQTLDPSAWSAMLASGWGELDEATFWVAVLKLIWINILLSGDNAVVIAMACRRLPGRQRLWGIALGAGIAILLRVIFTGVAAALLLLPYVKIAGGLFLLYIAAKLIVSDDRDAGRAGDSLWHAARIIAVADVVMSFDNVVAIATAAEGNTALLVFGLVISIPLIVAGAALITALFDRFPVLIWAGAGLLGWIAGQVIATDPVAVGALGAQFGAAAAHQAVLGAEIGGAMLVLVAGFLWRRWQASSGSGA